jgi:hypothetical protein
VEKGEAEVEKPKAAAAGAKNKWHERFRKGKK